MPILVSNGPDGIVISDIRGVAFSGRTGSAGEKTKIRRLVGSISFKDIDTEGHKLLGLIRNITIPYTGPDETKRMPFNILFV